jgi:hypothetical protein
MDSNLIVDSSTWEAGKDYPSWMDEISLATFPKVIYYLAKHLKRLIDE